MRTALLFTLIATASVACAPAVGDSCVSSSECAPGQICDTASPGGYCTILDCEANSCPGNSVCVGFELVVACMETCSSDNDCRERDGYVCRDDLGPTPFCYQPAEGSG